MKAHYKTANGRITFEVQGDTPKVLFAEIAHLQEVFEVESTCGCCQGVDIRFQLREVDKYKFYELQCQRSDCRARFSFGQSKEGGALFPKRKGEDGKYLPNRGWVKYQPKQRGGGAAAGDGPPDWDRGFDDGGQPF